MFQDIIEKLRKKRELKKVDVAKAIGVEDSTYRNYAAGRREPSYEILCKLADFYNVTTDYLLGREQQPPPDPIEQFVQGMGLSENEAILVKTFFSIKKEKRREFIEAFCIGASEELEKKKQKLDAITEEQTAATEENSDNIVEIPLMVSRVSAGTGCMLSEDEIDEMFEIDRSIYPKADFATKVRGDSMIPRFNDGDVVLVHKQETIESGQIGVFMLNGDGYIKKLVAENGKTILRSLNSEYKDIEVSENDNLICRGLVLYRLE